jgi:pimeloyl-ACP methyl ester carboxylesterase
VLLFALLVGCSLAFQEGPVDTTAQGRRFVEIDGFKLHYDVIGEGAPVLFLHGYSSFFTMWERTARDWADGHRSILVDLPGHGLSDRRDVDYRPAAIARTLVAFLDHLGEGRVNVVAHSWGASVALALALEAPDRVGRIVLVDAWTYEEQNGTFMAWAQVPGVGEALYGVFYDQHIEERYARAFLEPDKWMDAAVLDKVHRYMGEQPGAKAAGLAVVRALQHLPEQEVRYGEIEHETLLVWCREDPVALVHYGERLSSELKNARLEVIPRCGHIPVIEQYPAYMRHLRGFL